MVKNNTVWNIMGVEENFIQGLEKHKKVGSILLDLSKAFDCLDHNLLLTKLYENSLRGHPLKGFGSFFPTAQNASSNINDLS